MVDCVPARWHCCRRAGAVREEQVTTLAQAEERIAELEAVCLVAHDALVFLYQVTHAILEQYETKPFVMMHPDWLYEVRQRTEVAMAATKHRRI